VTYSEHAQEKLALRKVKVEDVEKVINRPTEAYEDVEHHARVAIGSVGDRFLIVVYSLVNADIKVITVYHASNIEKLVSSKTKRGVWRRTE
jgi:uncharacterized DUF497 family protein